MLVALPHHHHHHHQVGKYLEAGCTLGVEVWLQRPLRTLQEGDAEGTGPATEVSTGRERETPGWLTLKSATNRGGQGLKEPCRVRWCVYQPLALFGRAAFMFEYENAKMLKELLAAIDKVRQTEQYYHTPAEWCQDLAFV